MLVSRIGPIQQLCLSLNQASGRPTLWRSVLVDGNCPFGVRTLAKRLERAGYHPVARPARGLLTPTYSVVQTKKRWNYGMHHHRVFVVGNGVTSWEDFHWAHSVLESGNASELDVLIEDLPYHAME